MSNDTLNDILIECARLRGCYPLIHRTLVEFCWFCDAAICGFISEDEEERRIYETYNYAFTNNDDELIKLAEAFLDYCRKEYSSMELYL